jgi:hypothetical protein
VEAPRDFESLQFISHPFLKTTNNQSVTSLTLKTWVLPRLVLIGRNWHQFELYGQSNGQRYVWERGELINPSPHIPPHEFIFAITGNASFFATSHHCFKIPKPWKLVYYIPGQCFSLSGARKSTLFYQGNVSKSFQGID